jgi:sporulation protein YlmC with PRC-barrel domain
MAHAAPHANHQLISSTDVEGTNVYDPSGKKIGEIDHLMIDKISGRVAYAVMIRRRPGRPQPLSAPLERAQVQHQARRLYETVATEAQLRDASAFSGDSWSDRTCCRGGR